jgi:hypothetical protein
MNFGEKIMKSWMESRGDKISIFPSMAFREEERERRRGNSEKT